MNPLLNFQPRPYTMINDIPGGAGMVSVMTKGIAASASSDDNQGEVICGIVKAGTVEAIKFMFDADQTGHATVTKTLQVINKGTGGAGTTVIGSLSLTDTDDYANDIEHAFTLSTTATELVVADGDVLRFNAAMVGNGIAVGKGTVQVEFE